MIVKGFKFIFLIFLVCSCSDNAQQVKIENQDLDKLLNTNISISKGNQKVVDAVAKELSKDNIHIYLKADYDSDEIKKIRNKLSISIIQKPDLSTHIRNVAEELHLMEGNIKAEFYDTYNQISSVLYSFHAPPSASDTLIGPPNIFGSGPIIEPLVP